MKIITQAPGWRITLYKCTAEITFLEISCLYSSSKISKIMEEREGASLPRSCNILDTTQKLVSIELSEPKIIINVSTTINIANILT